MKPLALVEGRPPLRIVAIGGSTRPGSTTEQLLRLIVHEFRPDAVVSVFSGPDLLLPHYVPGQLSAEAHSLVAAVRAADVVILGSPGYHGSLSGTVKNALDYLEELAADRPAYLDGKVVACVATAHGWQAAVNTMGALRQIVSALRGWCPPFGIAINVTNGYLESDGTLCEARLRAEIEILVNQIHQFLKTSGPAVAPQPTAGPAVRVPSQ